MSEEYVTAFGRMLDERLVLYKISQRSQRDLQRAIGDGLSKLVNTSHIFKDEFKSLAFADFTLEDKSKSCFYFNEAIVGIASRYFLNLQQKD